MARSFVSSWHSYTKGPSIGIVYKYMSTSPNHSDENQTPPEKSTVILLLGDIGDTTWRMFVPTVGLTVLGLLADREFNTTPWLMVTGIIVGSLLAGLLVRRQLKKVKE